MTTAVKTSITGKVLRNPLTGALCTSCCVNQRWIWALDSLILRMEKPEDPDNDIVIHAWSPLGYRHADTTDIGSAYFVQLAPVSGSGGDVGHTDTPGITEDLSHTIHYSYGDVFFSVTVACSFRAEIWRHQWNLVTGATVDYLLATVIVQISGYWRGNWPWFGDTIFWPYSEVVTIFDAAGIYDPELQQYAGMFVMNSTIQMETSGTLRKITLEQFYAET